MAKNHKYMIIVTGTETIIWFISFFISECIQSFNFKSIQNIATLFKTNNIISVM